MLRLTRPLLKLHLIQKPLCTGCVSYHNQLNFKFENKASHEVNKLTLFKYQPNELISCRSYSMWSRVAEVFKKPFTPKTQIDDKVLMHSATVLYIICAEYPEFEKFVKTLELPDTLNSWFCITTIHMWLCCFRLKNEGEDFTRFHQKLFDSMTEDLTERIKSYPGIGLKRRKYEKLLTGLYYMTFIQLDLAMMSGRDDVLAELIWNLLYQQKKTTKPQNLEILIRYIYSQMQHLETISPDHILKKGIVTFTPFQTLTHDVRFAEERLKFALHDLPDIDHN